MCIWAALSLILQIQNIFDAMTHQERVKLLCIGKLGPVSHSVQHYTFELIGEHMRKAYIIYAHKAWIQMNNGLYGQ